MSSLECKDACNRTALGYLSLAMSQKPLQLITKTSRDDNVEVIRSVVAALGGVTKASKAINRRCSTIYDYLDGRIQPSSSVVARLSKAAEMISIEQLATSHRLKAIEAETLEREARKVAASRERYYARFGRYPVPARGNKTP